MPLIQFIVVSVSAQKATGAEDTENDASLLFVSPDNARMDYAQKP